jgi:hypothetical protein
MSTINLCLLSTAWAVAAAKVPRVSKRQADPTGCWREALCRWLGPWSGLIMRADLHELRTALIDHCIDLVAIPRGGNQSSRLPLLSQEV